MSIYQGSSLRVDLTSQEISRGSTPENGIGGRTWNSVTLLRELDAGIDPLGPENVLILACSVVTGAPISGFNRYSVGTKSPLTGTVTDSHQGGWSAARLRWAGLDGLVFAGRSERPVYAFVSEGQVELRDASEIWGRDIHETVAFFRQRYGEKNLSVCAIGRAVGECVMPRRGIFCEVLVGGMLRPGDGIEVLGACDADDVRGVTR